MLANLSRWARLKHHALAERQARRHLALATGDTFVAARDRVLELSLCPDPLACDCLAAKPLRKLAEG